MSTPRIEKRRLLKDPVWGNLEIFSWESQLLNHFLFNRLHNIVQNSSAYKVYPGLKYSRFLHSVGVCHVATQLFLNAAAKAEDAARSALDIEAKMIGGFLSEEAKSTILHSISHSFPCHPSDGVMLAAIRIVALIHDIGHLPYSHIFENALDAFCHGEIERAVRFTPAGRKQRANLNKALTQRHHANGSDVKLHETIGKIFVEVLEKDFQNDPEISGLLRAASRILGSNDLPIAKGFIVGTIDADRIDFVRRDGFFSGLFNSSVDFGRIFSFYELAYDEDTKCWLPRPSPRTISETEKLLLERFLDYKYIVVHHRVHLYDEIMENVLVRLMANGRLDSFLETLCELLEFKPENHSRLHGQEKHVKTLRVLLTQFDDPWVEVEIRKQYDNLKDNDDTATKLLFEAYVEDRQCFRSAFKTDEDFQKECKEYAPQLMNKEPSLVREAFGVLKYMLQKKLSDKLGRTVLIGATDKKLSYGIRNESAAKFISASDLHEFLIRKKIHSLTFNFWYAQERGGQNETKEERDTLINGALTFLAEEVTKQLQLPIGQ